MGQWDYETESVHQAQSTGWWLGSQRPVALCSVCMMLPSQAVRGGGRQEARWWALGSNPDSVTSRRVLTVTPSRKYLCRPPKDIWQCLQIFLLVTT